MIGRLRTPRGRDALLTLAAEGLAMLGMVYAYRLAALRGDADLGSYVIVRRTVSFLFPVLLLGAAISLTRFVAMTGSPDERRRYLAAALTWVLPLSALVICAGLLLPEELSWIVFGDATGAALIPPLGVMIAGIGLHGMTYAQLRGAGLGAVANAAQVAVLAAIPCASFFLFDDLRPILWATAWGWIAVPLVLIAALLLGRTPMRLRVERARLLRFGLPRVPGDVAMGALLTVPVYVAVRTFGADLGGQVGFGATLLNLASAVFNPVALLLLPAASEKLAAGDHAGLSAGIGRLSHWMIGSGAALMLGFEVLAGPLLSAYIGDAAGSYLFISRLCFLGALPFGYFFGMRSVLDAYHHTPRNGLNLLKAFGIMLAGALLHLVVPTPPYTMAVVMVIALWWLGWATWRDVRFVRSELDRLAATGADHPRMVEVVSGGRTGPVEGSSTLSIRLRSGSLMERRRLKRALHRARPDVVIVRHDPGAALLTVMCCSAPVVIAFDGRGGAIAQLAAFFSASILCPDEAARDRLWWRAEDAHVVRADDHDGVMRRLRAAAGHLPRA